MATIDDKVVSISFETKDFEDGTKRVLSGIDQLNKGLQFQNAGQGLSELQRHVSAFSLAGMAENIQNIASHFSILGAIGFTVIQDLTNGVLDFGKMVASKVIDPIVQGGKQRALNIEAAKFQFRALGQNVDKAMASALAAVKGTAFGLDEAAKAAGQFGAAGIKSGSQMTGALRGVAGVAAVTNSSFADISQIFTTIAGAGKINSEQLYQFATRGLNVAAALAKQFHTTEANVRTMASEGKISFKEFAGAMDDAFGKHAKEANQTFTGALANLHAAMSRVGADFWEPFLVAQRNVFNALSPFIDNLHTAIQPLIDLFGRTVMKRSGDLVKFINGINLADLTKGMPFVADGLKNILRLLHTLMGPIKDAFRDIFPASTGKQFTDLAKRFDEFVKALKPSQDTLDGLRRTFRGLFALLDIGKQILSGIFDVFKRVFDAVAGGSGSFLDFTGNIGDFIVKIDQALKNGKGLENFFNGLGDWLVAPVKMIGILKDAISSFFDSISPGGVSGKGTGLAGVFAGIGTAFGNMLEAFSHSDRFINNVLDAMSQLGQAIGPALQAAFKNINFEAILAVIRTGLLGGLVLMVKQFVGKGSLAKQLGSGLFGSISNPLNELTDSLKSMQRLLQAKTLKEIAIAVALLAASVVALSFVNPQRLSAALGAMTVAFGELLAGMAILTGVTRTVGFIKIPLIATSLILLAGAIVILSAAVVILGQLDWGQLTRGLIGVGALLTMIVIAAVPLSFTSAGMIRAGVGITAIAVGLLILSEAVKRMSELSWGDMAKGLIGVGVGLVILLGATRLMPTSQMIATGAGLILMAAALKIIAGVVKTFGNMDLSTIGKGMLGIGAALVVIGTAMRLMPANMLLISAGLLIVSVALGRIASVIANLGGMSISEIAKGLGTLAGALILLSVALYAMSGSLAGAAALTIAAAGISVLAGALVSIGNMSWQQIVTSLIALAAAFAIIGVAGLLVEPAIPGLLGLGAAMLLIGGGLALAGVGISLIAAGLSALIVALPTGIGIVVAALKELVQGAIESAKLLVLGVLEILRAFANTAPQFVDALVKIFNSLADGLIKINPKMMILLQLIIDDMVKLLDDNQATLIQAGIDLLLGLLKGIRDNIGQVVAMGIGIIAAFLNGIANNVPRIVSAGLNIVIKFVQGVGNNIGRIVNAGANVIVKFIRGIGDNYQKILDAGGTVVARLIRGIANNANKIVTAGTNAIISFATGLEKNTTRLVNASGQLLLNFLHDLKKAIDKYSPQITQASIEIGVALIAGIIKGVGQEAGKLYTSLEGIAQQAKDKLGKLWNVLSPSKVTQELGRNIMLGLVVGVQDNAHLFVGAIEDSGRDAKNAMRQSLSAISSTVDELDANPIITPILDLSQVRNQAGELTKLTANPKITAGVSSQQALRISPLTADEKTLAALAGPAVHYEQNISSPKPLSEVEIYRHTRNQLSQLKSALALN